MSYNDKDDQTGRLCIVNCVTSSQNAFLGGKSILFHFQPRRGCFSHRHSFFYARSILSGLVNSLCASFVLFVV
jgi:hypothetical protein